METERKKNDKEGNVKVRVATALPASRGSSLAHSALQLMQLMGNSDYTVLMSEHRQYFQDCQRLLTDTQIVFDDISSSCA